MLQGKERKGKPSKILSTISTHFCYLVPKPVCRISIYRETSASLKIHESNPQ